MSFSFPKPARRRSARPGDRNMDDRDAGGQNVSNPRKPKPAAGHARAKERSGGTGGHSRAGHAPGPALAPVAPRSGEDGPESRSGGRDDNQEAPVLPGIKPVLELLRNTPERADAVFLRKGRHGKDMERIVDLCRAAGVRFSLLDPASFARVHDGRCQGVVARLFEAGFADLDDLLSGAVNAPLPLVLALDQVQDPGNAGALIRTLYALGGAGLVTPRHNGVYLGAAAAKAAAGTLDRLPISKAPNLGQAVDSAKKAGFTIYGSAAGYGSASHTGRERRAEHGEPFSGEEARPKNAVGERLVSGKPVVDVFSLSPRLPAMLILGGEEDGMRVSMEKRCDCLIRIPMLRDFDSLNVAQAGGIIISWFARAILRSGPARRGSSSLEGAERQRVKSD